MNKTELIRALDQLEEERGIGKDVIIEAIEAALLSAYKKTSGSVAQNMRVEVDRRSGEVHVYQIKTVADAVEDPSAQISLAEARRQLLGCRQHIGAPQCEGGQMETAGRSSASRRSRRARKRSRSRSRRWAL